MAQIVDIKFRITSKRFTGRGLSECQPYLGQLRETGATNKLIKTKKNQKLTTSTGTEATTSGRIVSSMFCVILLHEIR